MDDSNTYLYHAQGNNVISSSHNNVIVSDTISSSSLLMHHFSMSISIGNRCKCHIAVITANQYSFLPLCMTFNMFLQRALPRKALIARPADKWFLHGFLLRIGVSKSDMLLQSGWMSECGTTKSTNLIPLSAMNLFMNIHITGIRK